MNEKIDVILNELKEAGFATSKIEMELGFSNGLLGKARKGETNLSEDKFTALDNFYKINLPKLPVIEKENKPAIDKSIIEKVKKSISTVPKNTYEKLETLKLTIDKINKDFGEGSVMCMGDVVKKQDNVISTGSIALNEALGIGGLPCGRMIEIYGQESSGKTTLAIHVIVEAQRLGGRCAIVDAEQAFDPDYAEKLGVDLDRLEICQPDYGEQGLEIADRLIETKSFNVVIVDSVAALIPKRELEGEAGDSAMGRQALIMSQACRKMVASVAKTNTLLIWINQLRSRIGGMPNQSPWITTGGNALKFFCSVRLDISSIAKLKDGEEIIGNRAKVKVVKNKMAPPFKNAEFDILFGLGIDKIGEIIDVASSLNIIKKSGSWFSYEESKLGQGRESVRQLLKDHSELLSEIELKIKNYSPLQN